MKNRIHAVLDATIWIVTNMQRSVRIMRLIDADKIDFNEAFVGASEFAQDTRNAAQMLIDNQSTVFDVDKVVEQLDVYITKLVGRNSALYQTVIQIVKGGGVG